jgi:hypothetical protein
VFAIDLNQITDARPPQSRLLNCRWPELARNPKSRSDLKAPDGFLGQINAMLGLEINPTGSAAAYRRASLRTRRDDKPRRSAARYGFKSPSTTAWIHFDRSRLHIASGTLVYCLLADLQVLVGDQEISAQQVERGHLNLARAGQLNLAATSIVGAS